MVKRARLRAYRLWLEAEVHEGRNDLPGKVRQRIKKLIDGLSAQPRPSISKTLDTEDLAVPAQIEIRRLRLENWRIIYAVNDAEKWVWVLAIRQRPPYDYEDLTELASPLSE
jgi:mRNA-degrading endonuclease RelE of RelBE toxin-antitoxin system